MKKLTEGHYHEICDRSHIIAENIEQFLIKDFGSRDAFVKKKAEAAVKLIYDIYQHAGIRF